MQFETTIVARIPRANCAKCGVANIAVPWAEPHSRFTLLFESFAIDVLKAAGNVQKACELLSLTWGSLHLILERAVERGLARRSLDNIENLGVDEKSFRSGQDYVTVVTDIDHRRVLEVSEGRDEAAASTALSTLSNEQKAEVKAVALDMSASLINSARNELPNADIVHDRFHISKHLNEAVDKVRRQENKELSSQGDSRLKGTKYTFLRNPADLSDVSRDQLHELRASDLRTARAWALRENFRNFWNYRTAGWAKRFFDEWYNWAIRTRLEPIKKAARTIKSHLANILTWFRHRISNGTAEGYNSVIQSLKTAARGFRNFANYRLRILFACGRLDMKPSIPPGQ